MQAVHTNCDLYFFLLLAAAASPSFTIAPSMITNSPYVFFLLLGSPPTHPLCRFELTKVYTDDGERPLVSTAFLPDGRMLVATKNGEVRVLVENAASNTFESSAYLTLAEHPLGIENGKELGLLSLVIDPDFATTGHIYMYWSPEQNGRRNFRLSRFTHSEMQGLLTSQSLIESEVILWEATGGYSACCHYGGGLVITPPEVAGDMSSRSIFLFTGDQFLGFGASQNMTSSWGKVHRLNMDGSPPTSNLGMDDGIGGLMLDTVYATGVRNPYRATWDSVHSQILFADVGGNDQALSWEEVNVLRPDANYGWPFCEGACDNPDFPTCSCFAHESPVISYAHGRHQGGRATSSIIGGLVYSGNQFPDNLHGKYMFADYVHRKVYVADLGFNPGAHGSLPDEIVLDGIPGPIVDLAEGPHGSLWMTTLSGCLYTIRNVAGNRRPNITSCSVDVISGSPPLNVHFAGTSEDPDVGHTIAPSWDFGDGSAAAAAHDTVHTYTTNGVYTASYLAVDQLGASARCLLRIQVGWLPEASIVTPVVNTAFRAGEMLVVAAQESANITMYSWTLNVLHNEHRHPVFSDVLGSSTSYTVEKHGHSYSDRVILEIELTVESQEGLISMTTLNVYPDKRNVTLVATAPDVSVLFDGIPYPNGTVIDTLVAFEHTVQVPLEVCDWEGKRHVFQAWSTGRAAEVATFTVPEHNSNLVAIYRVDGYCSVRTGALDPNVDLTLVVRLNAGASGPYIDNSGAVWALDNAYEVGPSRSLSKLDLPRNTISFPTSVGYPEIYYEERYAKPRDGDGNINYIIPVPTSAVYRVRLHFTDTYYEEAGSRVFDIVTQGVTAFQHFDIAGRNGYKQAVVVEMDVTVDHGEPLTITMQRGAAENPTICGLEVFGVNLAGPNTSSTPVTSTGATTAVSTSPTGSPTTSSPTTSPTGPPTTSSPTTTAPTELPTSSPIASSTTTPPSTLTPTTGVPSASTTTAPQTVSPSTATPKTFAPMVPVSTTVAPQTAVPSPETPRPSSTPSAVTVTPADCALAVCGRTCAELPGCGWSRGKMECRVGGKTAKSEMDMCGGPPATVSSTLAVVYNADGTTDCSAATCGIECLVFPGCGWSTGKMECRKDGRTTLSELESGVCGGGSTISPQTIATVAPQFCKFALCGRDCAELSGCGWSSGRNDCRSGARTTQSEMDSGICGSTAAPERVANCCKDEPCAKVCATMPGCGWSRGKNSCRSGARTTKSEMELGVCP
jgi:glucose/arabinose dehydrogenase/PKD repeat protein